MYALGVGLTLTFNTSSLATSATLYNEPAKLALDNSEKRRAINENGPERITYPQNLVLLIRLALLKPNVFQLETGRSWPGLARAACGLDCTRILMYSTESSLVPKSILAPAHGHHPRAPPPPRRHPLQLAPLPESTDPPRCAREDAALVPAPGRGVPEGAASGVPVPADGRAGDRLPPKPVEPKGNLPTGSFAKPLTLCNSLWIGVAASWHSAPTSAWVGQCRRPNIPQLRGG